MKPPKYICLKCSTIIKSSWQDTPQRGDYLRCKCGKCNNAESSTYRHHLGNEYSFENCYFFERFKLLKEDK